VIEQIKGIRNTEKRLGDLSMTFAVFHFLTSFSDEKDSISMAFSSINIQAIQKTIARQCLEHNYKHI